MREILFRGQTRRYGEKVRMGDGAKLPSRWVYGGVLQGIGDFSIIYGGENMNDPSEGLGKFPVYTDTLGQYTGLTANGKKIFEGDIVDASDEWRDAGGPAGHASPIIAVEWNEALCGFAPFADYDCDCGVYINASGCKVIGNIHDNPELLEVSHE